MRRERLNNGIDAFTCRRDERPHNRWRSAPACGSRWPRRLSS